MGQPPRADLLQGDPGRNGFVDAGRRLHPRPDREGDGRCQRSEHVRFDRVDALRQEEIAQAAVRLPGVDGHSKIDRGLSVDRDLHAGRAEEWGLEYRCRGALVVEQQAPDGL